MFDNIVQFTLIFNKKQHKNGSCDANCINNIVHKLCWRKNRNSMTFYSNTTLGAEMGSGLPPPPPPTKRKKKKFVYGNMSDSLILLHILILAIIYNMGTICFISSLCNFKI